MASVVILLGSLLGFATGLVAFFGLDASLWSAVLIWLGAGPLSALLVICAGLRAPTRPHAEGSRAPVEAA